MKKKKGFTLVELVAVIIILAVITLIAVPIVSNILTSSKKNSYKASATNIIRAVETELANNDDYEELPLVYTVDKNGIKQFDSEVESEIGYTGKIDGEGYIHINYYESTSLCICNDEYCATKYYSDKEVSVKEKEEGFSCEDFNASNSLLVNVSTNATVQINEEFNIFIPEVVDTEGEPLEVKYEVFENDVKLGDNTTMKKLGTEYTNELNRNFKINYTVYDPSINNTENKTQFVTVVDAIAPTLELTVKSANNQYRSLTVNLGITATDDTNLKMYVSDKGYYKEGNLENYSTTKNYTLSGSYDGVERTIYVTVIDEAGNKTEKNIKYTPYTECTFTEVVPIVGSCNVSCGYGTKKITNNTTDLYTSKVCSTTSTDESCYAGSCSSPTTTTKKTTTTTRTTARTTTRTYSPSPTTTKTTTKATTKTTTTTKKTTTTTKKTTTTTKRTTAKTTRSTSCQYTCAGRCTCGGVTSNGCINSCIESGRW